GSMLMAPVLSLHRRLPPLQSPTLQRTRPIGFSYGSDFHHRTGRRGGGPVRVEVKVSSDDLMTTQPDWRIETFVSVRIRRLKSWTGIRSSTGIALIGCKYSSRR